jgi:hypothetical protein
MTTWSEVTGEAKALADAVRERFEATGLALLATLRRDGSPRISGVEPLFAGGELWLGMMPGSRKALDLRRDPRCALHNATVDKQVTKGDAKIAGHAIEVDDDATVDRYLEAFEATTGYRPPPGPFHLFRLDVTEVSFVEPGGDHLLIQWWKPGGPVYRIERR